MQNKLFQSVILFGNFLTIGVDIMVQTENIIFNIYSIVIIFIIYFFASKFFKRNSMADKLYMQILNVTVILLTVDILSRFDGKSSIIHIMLNHSGNFFLFLLSPVLPSLWVVYVHFQIFQDEKRTKKLLLPLCVINAINIITLIISQFYGWFYYIDSNNIRGPFFLVPASMTIILILAAAIIIVANYKKLDKRNCFSLILLAIPPFISILFQIRFYGISLMLNSLVLPLLTVLLTVQNHKIYTDYLTGVSNREKLDAYLKEKVCTSTKEKSFSAILIDINNFKHINDTYGHNMGDDALETAAKLLKSCLRTNDFIARYGGDEFCVILDISDKKDLENLVSRINNCLEKHNRSGTHNYKLEFSMGYAVYDYQTYKSPEEFLHYIDMLMYEDKRNYKNKIKVTV